MNVSLPWTHGRVPRGFWQLKKNRLLYLRWLGKRLRYTRPDDWYEVTKNDFAKNFGGGLLANYYKDSYINALKELYPDKQWYPWLFGHQRNTWTQPKIRKAYLNWLKELLGYTTLDDWYRITEKDFSQIFNHSLNFDNNPSVVKAKKAKKCKNLSMRPEVNIELLKVSTDRILKKIKKILKLKKLNRKKKIGIVINLI